MRIRKLVFFFGILLGIFFVGTHANADVDMLRLYNPNSGEHFYTKDTYERDSLVAAGWTFEGVGWVAPNTGAPVFRLYNPNAGDHFYTLLPYEKQSLITAGWKDEGIGWYSGGSVALLRAYNPNAAAGSHNYTTSSFEQTSLVSNGWKDEGTAWYALAAGHSVLPDASTPLPPTPLPSPGTYAKAPTYFSQLDPRWSNVVLNEGTVGPDGCVPTSLAMILVGSYGIATDPGQVALRMDGISTLAHGVGGKDLMNTVPTYGRTIEEVSSIDRVKSLLQQGVPLIFYVNVGVGHAVAAYGLNADGDSTLVYDPFGQKFYPAGSLVSVEKLFSSLSMDSADWDAGTPVFAIK